VNDFHPDATIANAFINGLECLETMFLSISSLQHFVTS